MRNALTPGCAASVSWLRLMPMPASSETPGFHGFAEEKSSVISRWPTPGLRSGVGPRVGRTSAVGVSEGGNQTVVGVAVAAIGVAVGVLGVGAFVATAAQAGESMIIKAENKGRMARFMKDFTACCTIKGVPLEYTRQEAASPGNSIAKGTGLFFLDSFTRSG